MLFNNVPPGLCQFQQIYNKKCFGEKINMQMNTYTFSCSFSRTSKNKSKTHRVPFTKEEDDQIIELTEKYGYNQWNVISSYIKGRTAKQCRDRYSNYLVPGFFKGEWSKEEDSLLIKMYNQFGKKWSILKRFFPNRSSHSIKNRWNYFLSKHQSEENLNDFNFPSKQQSEEKETSNEINDDFTMNFFFDENEDDQNEDSFLNPIISEYDSSFNF